MFFLMTSIVLALISPSQQANSPTPASPARLADAIAQGRLAWQLSEPDEVAAVLGPPATDETGRDGGMEFRSWTCGDGFRVIFGRDAAGKSPFVLAEARDGSRFRRLRNHPRARFRPRAQRAVVI